VVSRRWEWRWTDLRSFCMIGNAGRDLGLPLVGENQIKLLLSFKRICFIFYLNWRVDVAKVHFFVKDQENWLHRLFKDRFYWNLRFIIFDENSVTIFCYHDFNVFNWRPRGVLEVLLAKKVPSVI
jgi:hypothetical protein